MDGDYQSGCENIQRNNPCLTLPPPVHTGLAESGCHNAEKEKLQKYEEMMEKVKTQLTQMDK